MNATHPNANPPQPPNAAPAPPKARMSDDVQTWVMVVLTFAFVVIYFLALFGVVQPLRDDKMVGHLQPIIFVIVGYYFGRLPGQSNERTLQGEVDRQARQAADAQQERRTANEQVGQERAKLSEAQQRLKDVRQVLVSAFAPPPAAGLRAGRPPVEGETYEAPAPADAGQVIQAALRILDQ